MKKNKNKIFWLAALLLVVGLSACAREGEKGPSVAPFQPPTVAAQGGPLAELSTAAPRPTLEPALVPTPACTNILQYLEDLTLPDGSLVHPGDAMDKRWRVQNSGTCNWNENYRIKLVSGPEMGVPAEQALYPARAGSQAVLRILLLAPGEAGTYQSAWQAFSPEGEAFGDPFYIEIVVETP